MSELIYLLLAMVFSAVGSVAVWHRHTRPQSLESGVDDFARGLDALAGEVEKVRSRRSA